MASVASLNHCEGETTIPPVKTCSIKNKLTVILGAQWGDEGKGKIVDLLATNADIVCRVQVRQDVSSVFLGLFHCIILFFKVTKHIT